MASNGKQKRFVKVIELGFNSSNHTPILLQIVGELKSEYITTELFAFGIVDCRPQRRRKKVVHWNKDSCYRASDSQFSPAFEISKVIYEDELVNYKNAMIVYR